MGREGTVVIPTIGRRKDTFLQEAIKSCQQQTMPVTVLPVPDPARNGASPTRNHGAMQVDTEWTFFLDDDDILTRHHCEFLMDRAEEHDLDLAWPWFKVVGGTDPFPKHRGRQLDPANPHIFPIAVIVRTEMMQEAINHMGGFQPDTPATGSWMIQDWPVWKDIVVRQGGKHMAFPDVTWYWRHHGGNTSGLGAEGQRKQAARRSQ